MYAYIRCTLFSRATFHDWSKRNSNASRRAEQATEKESSSQARRATHYLHQSQFSCGREFEKGEGVEIGGKRQRSMR
ncbi:unnamed protein product, partial [Nesidiocoris tenuis]